MLNRATQNPSCRQRVDEGSRRRATAAPAAVVTAVVGAETAQFGASDSGWSSNRW